ncbi:hypothetical protein GWK47_010586 [Chionoecetes opilio]|uniref:Uncharacterized protein n=1 Tax=Chionoecetes opilio TaxID=41210 RepID=A0A8J4XYF7_CHIOP|nr:hypothetical protein GWK47_010586 [Chionoecetes opilio]
MSPSSRRETVTDGRFVGRTGKNGEGLARGLRRALLVVGAASCEPCTDAHACHVTPLLERLNDRLQQPQWFSPGASRWLWLEPGSRRPRYEGGFRRTMRGASIPSGSGLVLVEGPDSLSVQEVRDALDAAQFSGSILGDLPDVAGVVRPESNSTLEC